VINWTAIQRKGEEGLLTAIETDALIELAKAGVSYTTRPDDCLVCGATSYLTELQHAEDCPVPILEAIGGID